jgi:hypothetical protein
LFITPRGLTFDKLFNKVMRYIFLVLLLFIANLSFSQSKKAKKLVNQANEKVLSKDYQGAISDFTKR